MLAASNGRVPVVRLLLEAEGIEVNATCESGTALHEAARMGHFEIVCMLERSGADLLATNSSGQTPMQAAAATAPSRDP